MGTNPVCVSVCVCTDVYVCVYVYLELFYVCMCNYITSTETSFRLEQGNPPKCSVQVFWKDKNIATKHYETCIQTRYWMTPAQFEF